MYNMQRYAQALASTGRNSETWLNYTAAIYALANTPVQDRYKQDELRQQLWEALTEDERTEARAIAGRVRQ